MNIFKSFRWALDDWDSYELSLIPRSLDNTYLRFDKVQHAIGGLLAAIIGGIVLTPLAGLLISLGFWFLWEVKDGLVRYEDVGFWGGDGFSWKDMVSSWTGAFLGFIILLLLL